MNAEPTIGLALLAGLISFLSPCVLPLIPAYIGYMSGQATRQADQTQAQRNKLGTFTHGVFFVLGFTIFFVIFGILTKAAADTLDAVGVDIQQILTRLGGVAVILFGLYVMRALDPVFRQGLKFSERMRENLPQAVMFTLVVSAILLAYYWWVFEHILYTLLAFMLTILLFHKALREAESLGDFWYRVFYGIQISLATDTRNLATMSNLRGGGYFNSLAMGTVFAAGWTPCIGPIYGSILTLTATAKGDAGSLANAATLLTAYSLGLGIPFLLAALALNQMTSLMGKLKRNMRKIEFASGVLLIFIGLLVVSDNMTRIAQDFGSTGLGKFAYYLEDCAGGVWNDEIELSELSNCISTDGAPLKDDEVAETVNLASLQFAADPDFDTEAVPVGLQVGERAPDFETVTLEGEEITLADLRGQAVILNFWATWCVPCNEEMPDFQEIYNELGDQGVTVLAVNFLQEPDDIHPFMNDLELSFPVALDVPGTINDSYRIVQYPTTFLLDPNGVIYKVYYGPYPKEELLQDLNAMAAGG